MTDDTPFFIGTHGRHLGHGLDLRQVHRVFTGLRAQLGWINRGAHNGPRIHDLRHTFVVRRVLLWHAQGQDVDQQMLALSTCQGHVMVTNTYWYLTGIPELMAVAAERFESFTQMPEVYHGWLRRNPMLGADAALLPNRDAKAMTRFNVTQRLNIAVVRTALTYSSLSKRKISPHTIRYASAMHLLQSGVDISVIALWLGHESSKTMYMYVEADLAMKERALARLQDPGIKAVRYHAPDSLLQFLKSL